MVDFYFCRKREMIKSLHKEQIEIVNYGRE